MIKRSLTSFLDGLNAHKSHTCVKLFYLETPFQISTKSVEKYLSYARFSLLGRQAGWAGWSGRITKIGQDVKRLTLVQLPTKYQPNRSKDKKVIHFLKSVTTTTTPTRIELKVHVGMIFRAKGGQGYKDGNYAILKGKW